MSADDWVRFRRSTLLLQARNAEDRGIDVTVPGWRDRYLALCAEEDAEFERRIAAPSVDDVIADMETQFGPTTATPTEYPPVTRIIGEIPADEVVKALRKAVKSKVYRWGTPGAVGTADVGKVLWPDFLMRQDGRPTQCQLRLAQVLAKLVREGRVVRLRPKHGGAMSWTLPGVEFNRKHFGSHLVECGDA